jgi:hypothetical protein
MTPFFPTGWWLIGGVALAVVAGMLSLAVYDVLSTWLRKRGKT